MSQIQYVSDELLQSNGVQVGQRLWKADFNFMEQR